MCIRDRYITMTKLLHRIRTTRIPPNLKAWTHREYSTLFLVTGVIHWFLIPVTIVAVLMTQMKSGGWGYAWLIPWLLASTLGYWYIAYRVYTAGQVRDDG